jgi:putative sugar O-methyltransferase
VNEYVGSQGNRSVSDMGNYLAAVINATRSYKSFSRFKKDPRYQVILEHATKEQGDACLNIIKEQTPEFLNKFDLFKENDLVGGATLHQYKDVGQISPSTLRYIKVASDIQKIFGQFEMKRVAEIGVGYGGQLLVADKVMNIGVYDLYDLPQVLSLTARYLEAHILNCAYDAKTLNQYSGDAVYDLVISNYAFSELPSKLQLKYIDKILSKARRGYLTMNSGVDGSIFSEDKLSLEQLSNLLPPFEVLKESPLTYDGNYLIVWGHK